MATPSLPCLLGWVEVRSKKEQLGWEQSVMQKEETRLGLGGGQSRFNSGWRVGILQVPYRRIYRPNSQCCTLIKDVARNLEFSTSWAADQPQARMIEEGSSCLIH